MIENMIFQKVAFEALGKNNNCLVVLFDFSLIGIGEDFLFICIVTRKQDDSSVGPVMFETIGTFS